MTIFSDIQVADIVHKLIGEIEPAGDSALDGNIFRNQLTMQNTLDILLDDLQVLLKCETAYQYSIQRAGKTAREWMEEKRDWLNMLLGEGE